MSARSCSVHFCLTVGWFKRRLAESQMNGLQNTLGTRWDVDKSLWVMWIVEMQGGFPFPVAVLFAYLTVMKSVKCIVCTRIVITWLKRWKVVRRTDAWWKPRKKHGNVAYVEMWHGQSHIGLRLHWQMNFTFMFTLVTPVTQDIFDLSLFQAKKSSQTATTIK